MSNKPLLQVNSLSVSVRTNTTSRELIKEVSFTINESETLALVGESGSGKSITAQAILGLFQAPTLAITHGSVIFNGLDLCTASAQKLRELRGDAISFIPQSLHNSLNPTRTVGSQLIEHIRRPLSREEQYEEAARMLKQVGIGDAKRRLLAYPYELSGGTRQRVLLAMSLINKPKLVIADEPTTALDVTIQAEIIELLKSLKNSLKMALLFITHDFGVVADIADHIAIMYGGYVVETGSRQTILESPRHPYTKTLLEAATHFETRDRIKHMPLNTKHFITTRPKHGCPFALRCNSAMNICARQMPPLSTHKVRCWQEHTHA